ncbi:MAG: 2TM domain-containing protein [Thermomicrobiales bacterium]
MKQFWILRLFPRAWRERYEEEFQALLEDYDPSTGDTLDILKAAGDAQLRYRQLPEGLPAVAGGESVSPVAYRRARARVRWLASLYANAVLFVIVNLMLLGINLLTTPDTLWFIYPLWAWGMVLALHASLVLRGSRRLGAHVALFSLLNGGLIWINLAYTENFWFQWPLAATATLLIAHALIEFRITGYFGAHLVVYVLSLAQMAATALIYPESEYGLLTAGIAWTIALACHGLMRYSSFSPLKAHILLFAGVNAQIIVQNLMRSDELWFQYPLLVWAVVLGAHISVAMGSVPLFDPGWRERKQRELAGLAGLDSGAAGGVVEAEALDAIALRVESLRTLYIHLFAFITGAAAGLVLNILTYSAGPWALWPLWIWGMLLAAHAGWVLTRRGLFGSHLMLFLTANAGLIVIDLIQGGEIWFYWTLGATALALALHYLFSRDTLQAFREWESRRIASMVE